MDITKICNLLNAYMFGNVWNKPYTHFKKNIIPQRLYKKYSLTSKHSVTGGFQTPSHNILLPNSNEPYYVYYIDRSVLDNDLIDLTDEWKSSAELSNNRHTLTAVLNGFTLSRANVFFYHYKPSDDVFVAISKKMTDKMCGVDYNPDDLRIVLRNDWDDIDTSTCSSFVITNETMRIQTFNRSKQPYTYCFVNGALINTFNISNIVIGDYVDFVLDQRLYINYELDLSSDEGKNPVVLDNKIYSLCHTPKSLNPDNTILNCVDVDIFVYSVHDEIPSSGLYLYSDTLKLKQITHNDFGIPEDLLTVYGNILGSQELKIKIFIRKFTHSLKLTRDQNYIDLLYKHTDDEIIGYLTNTYVLNMNFWTASHLAESNYIKFLYSMPSFVDKTNIGTYIETFGYQNVLAILTDSIRKFKYDDDINYPLVVKKPSIFINNGTPLVYINGDKIPNSDLIVNRLSSELMSIRINGMSNLNNDDEVIVEQLETTMLSHVYFAPTMVSDRITLTDGYKVYERKVIDPILGVNTTFTFEYVEAKTGYTSVVVNNQRTYVFSAASFGKRFFFVPIDGTYVVEKTVTSDNLNPMFVDLNTSVLNTADTIPYLDINTTKVYLNNKSLVENIDYRFIQYKNDDNISGTQIIIYNSQYAINGDNLIEVIVSRNYSDKTNKFFRNINDNVIENVYDWFDSIGTVSVDGKQVLKAFNTNTGMYVEVPHRAGAIVETTVTYPKQLKEFISEFYTDEAANRERIISEYFNSITPVDNTLSTIPYAHSLYSLKVCKITNDIITNVLNIPFESNPFKLIDVDLVNYKYLDDLDILSLNINKSYIDFTLAYRDVEIPDVEKYKLIDHIAHVIIDDPLNYGGIN